MKRRKRSSGGGGGGGDGRAGEQGEGERGRGQGACVLFCFFFLERHHVMSMLASWVRPDGGLWMSQRTQNNAKKTTGLLPRSCSSVKAASLRARFGTVFYNFFLFFFFGERERGRSWEGWGVKVQEEEESVGVRGVRKVNRLHIHKWHLVVKTALWTKRTVQIKNQEKYSEEGKRSRGTVVWQMQVYSCWCYDGGHSTGSGHYTGLVRAAGTVRCSMG